MGRAFAGCVYIPRLPPNDATVRMWLIGRELCFAVEYSPEKTSIASYLSFPEAARLAEDILKERDPEDVTEYGNRERGIMLIGNTVRFRDDGGFIKDSVFLEHGTSGTRFFSKQIYSMLGQSSGI